MPVDECPVCFNKYNSDENKPILLDCGDTMCLKCINYYKESLQKDTFECANCCKKDAKSTNIMNKAVPLNNSNETTTSNSTASADGFFEVTIRTKNGDEFFIAVKKEYTIKKLKEEIKKVKNIEPSEYEFAFKKPLLDMNKTLEQYGITGPVTIIQTSNVEGGRFK